MGTDLPNRKRIRLKDYDYSQPGYYFITICTESRRMLLWSAKEITDNIIPLTEIGKSVEKALKNIGTIYPEICLDEYVIMPNHVHFILFIESSKDSGRPMVASTIFRIVQQLKGYVTKKYGQGSLWQKSYYEHIIRNEKDLQEKRNYILNNPLKWNEDEYFT